MRTSHTDLLVDAARRAGRYQEGLVHRTVGPDKVALANLGEFSDELPEQPTAPMEVLDLLDRLGSAATMASNGGRYFGFVNGGTDPAAQAAAIMVGAWDQNGATPVMSPIAARLDELAARWVCSLLGLPDAATATFCGGATIANITGIVAGRDALLHRLGWSVDEDGLRGAPPLRVITGEETHISVLKALRVLGFGRADITAVPTDGYGRVRADQIGVIDDHTLLVLQAGNVNTGHSDPFELIMDRVAGTGAWVHVDGAFGLWAAAAPGRAAQLRGVEQADSWATDGHKWLNLPYDCGIALCARAEDLRRALATDAAYVGNGDEDRVAMHLGLQMSQRARGVEVWAMLASRGSNGVAALVERCCALAELAARRFEELGAKVLVPVALNQVLIHFGDDATTDAVIDAAQREGTCWAGATTWQGQRAMRFSVSDEATTDVAIEVSVAAIGRCWAEVRATQPPE
ncbi:MAG: pyridoxal phosphate-dependent decarboxylase family protein [Acidimicrobiales bacterium]